MKTKLTSIVVAFATCALASAQAPKEEGKKGPRKPRAERPVLTEQKAAMEKRRAEWAKLTPEERKAKMKEGRAKMKELMEKYDKDEVKGLSPEERKALSADPEFKKMRANMPFRGRGGARGERGAGQGKGGPRGPRKEGARKGKKPASE